MQNPPEQLADFEVIETIGEGSFSKVKLVRRHLDGKLLALKQVNMDKLGPSERNSALNEIRLLASIRSPYVICYEGSFYDTSSNTLCLLMEYADNGDLEAVINNGAKKSRMQKGLPQAFIWRTILHLLQGLKTLHDNKIVHRDLKAANVFYSKGIAKLGDLNVSAVSDSTFYTTKTGTPYYTAPQIWNGENYTTNCDIWSLGCIVYEMCALLPPFRAPTFPELFAAVSRGEYQLLSEDYSEDMRTFIRMCLVLNQFDRPSASDLLNSAIVLKRFKDYQEDFDYSGKVDLIKPLKCPKVLRFINSILPQANENEDDAEQGQQAHHKVTFLKKTDLKPQSRGRIPSISKTKDLNEKGGIKSSIRIKSCKKIKNYFEAKSAKQIRKDNNEEKSELRDNSRCLQLQPLKTQAQLKTVIKPGVKNEKFRLRSCKRIGDGEKQNHIRN